MATIPTTSAFTAGEKPTASKLNANGKTALDFLLAPPNLSLRQAVAQSLTNATFTALTFDTEVVDTDSMWTSGTDITVKTAGLWQIVGHVSYASNATGGRLACIYVNGTEVRRTAVQAVNGLQTTVPISFMTQLAVNDVVTLRAYQASGGALNTDVASTATASAIQMLWKSI